MSRRLEKHRLRKRKMDRIPVDKLTLRDAVANLERRGVDVQDETRCGIVTIRNWRAGKVMPILIYRRRLEDLYRNTTGRALAIQ